MSSLTLWDHAFALIVFLLFPVYSKVTIAGLIEDVRKRGEPARLSAYKEVIVTWIGFAIGVSAMWFLFDREWAELGIRVADPMPLAIGAVVAAIFVSLFVLPSRRFSVGRQVLPSLDDCIRNNCARYLAQICLIVGRQ